jgi:hypothetical protein
MWDMQPHELVTSKQAYALLGLPFPAGIEKPGNKPPKYSKAWEYETARVKAAYKKLALKTHPSKASQLFPGDDAKQLKFTKEFQLLGKAMSVLNNNWLKDLGTYFGEVRFC